jgi:hypothetical protein
MVVFDQQSIVEAKVMIGAAAGTHGIFFQNAQAGSRFPGADYAQDTRRLMRRYPGRGRDTA